MYFVNAIIVVIAVIAISYGGREIEGEDKRRDGKEAEKRRGRDIE